MTDRGMLRSDWSSLVEPSSRLAKSSPPLVETTQIWRSRFDRAEPTHGPCVPIFGRIGPIFGRLEPRSWSNRAGIGFGRLEAWSNTTHIWSTRARTGSDRERIGTRRDRNWSSQTLSWTKQARDWPNRAPIQVESSLKLGRALPNFARIEPHLVLYRESVDSSPQLGFPLRCTEHKPVEARTSLVETELLRRMRSQELPTS